MTTLILGAGVFGASTAYHLTLSAPSTKVILLDRAALPPAPLLASTPLSTAASSDWNKIIRADYQSALYTGLMQPALAAWSTDPLFKPWYKPSGVLWFMSPALIQNAVDNYKNAGRELPEGCFLKEGLAAQQEGYFADAKLTDGQQCFFNPEGGWAMDKEATAAVLLQAVAQGTEYRQGEAFRLVRENNKVTGVELADGSIVNADRVVVCMGAGAIAFLERSGADVAVGEKLKAGGVLSVTVESGIDDQVYDKVAVLECGDDKMGMSRLALLSLFDCHADYSAQAVDTSRLGRAHRPNST